MSTYVPIQAITLSAATTSITFTGIPQTYTDLVIVFEGTVNGSNAKTIKFNSDTGANYSCTVIYGTGSSAASGRYTDSYLDVVNSFANRQATVVQVSNYSNTTTNKTYLSRHTCAASSTEAIVGLWRNTAAINTITINTGTANTFNTGCTFTLYGVGSGSPKAFGGDEVRTDGTYWYHIFRSSGRFEPAQTLSCEYVVVAGGGGGAAGGSGAGGFKTSIGGSALSLNANTSYTVTIGAGGTGSTTSYGGTNPAGRTKGNDSVFASITATGGGGAGSGAESSGGGTDAALSGGSGGGATYSSGVGKYGTGVSGEGFNGGQDNFNNPPYAGAGGGGAGGVGQNNQSDSVAGAGGIGAFNAITNGAQVGQLSGGNYYLAGGGGGGIYGLSGSGTGGAGGLGGGGAGSNGASGTTTGVNGTANTGGGCGGSSANATGRQGGSGVVIVRYAV